MKTISHRAGCYPRVPITTNHIDPPGTHLFNMSHASCTPTDDDKPLG